MVIPKFVPPPGLTTNLGSTLSPSHICGVGKIKTFPKIISMRTVLLRSFKDGENGNRDCIELKHVIAIKLMDPVMEIV